VFAIEDFFVCGILFGGLLRPCGGWRKDSFVRKLLAILLFLCLILVPAMALADHGDVVSGTELLYNGDFGVHTESAALPAGWKLSAFASDSSSVTANLTEDENGVATVTLHNLVANDARVCQTVSVSPETVYRLRADIRTTDVEYGTGASLSIDNYSIDGTYCYSEKPVRIGRLA
jgi:hypothetical protein